MANLRVTIQAYMMLIMMADANAVLSQETPPSTVQTCDTISRARPGSGVAYKGVVSNSDYRFSASIPSGLTGWGAGPSAPFHGFIIYLNTKSLEPSCIVFEIGIHVVLPEDSPPASTDLNETRRVKLGNRVGVQTSKRGSIHGISFENLSVSLELPRADHADYVAVTLVTPTKDEARTKRIFERFVSQFRFEAK
jgi:hypothetical protein